MTALRIFDIWINCILISCKAKSPGYLTILEIENVDFFRVIKFLFGKDCLEIRICECSENTRHKKYKYTHYILEEDFLQYSWNILGIFSPSRDCSDNCRSHRIFSENILRTFSFPFCIANDKSWHLLSECWTTCATTTLMSRIDDNMSDIIIRRLLYSIVAIEVYIK